MGKKHRASTPPPPDDEPRYLTVVHPYPLHANLDLHADRRALALWLACCTGKDVLLAMFHKPASPGMVIIEVLRDFDDNFDKLLGLHTWSECLLQPTEEQMDKSSKVFYCTYNTGRLVEKNGWKRVNIEEHWFQGWSANNSIIRYPYPKTSHCYVPSEAKTGAPMCRPLPQQYFPVPPPPPPPPAGSPGWLAARNANPSVILAPSSTNKGRKAAPGDSASVASTSSRGAKSLSPSPSITSPTPSAMANYRARNDVTWKRGPPVSSVASAITSRAPSTVGGSSARSSRGAPPASSLAPSLSFGPVRRPPYDPNGPAEPSRNYEYAEEDQPKHSTVAAMSDIFNDDPDYDQGNPPADAAEHAIDQSEAGDPEAPWEGYDIPRQEPATKVIIKPEGEWKCSQHGSLCSPGICEERARFEHDKRMEENRKKREEERKRREARREKNRKRREKKDAEAEAMGQGGRGPPPHFRRGNTSSGGGGSNNNASVPDTDPSRDRGSSVSPPPVQGDRSIPWEARSADAQSTMSSVLRARDSATGSDEDDCDREDDGASVTESDTSNRSSDASCSRSRSPAPASANFSVRSNDNGNASPPPASPTSPRPASPQSAQDARSSTSQTPSVSESVRPSVSGHSRAPSVSAASTTGSDTGQRSGTRPPTRQSTSDARSSVSSSARGRATPSVTPSGPEGFPSFDNTQWGDPIAMAMADAAKGESATGTSEDCAGQKLSKSAKKGSNAKSVPAPAPAQASTIETVFEVELPPGGPGSSWGDPDEPW